MATIDGLLRLRVSHDVGRSIGAGRRVFRYGRIHGVSRGILGGGRSSGLLGHRVVDRRISGRVATLHRVSGGLLGHRILGGRLLVSFLGRHHIDVRRVGHNRLLRVDRRDGYTGVCLVQLALILQELPHLRNAVPRAGDGMAQLRSRAAELLGPIAQLMRLHGADALSVTRACLGHS
jgi:hypothetical protein